MKEYTIEKGKDIEHWKRCFSQLASLTNAVMENVPKLLADAKFAMLVFNPPGEIKAFHNHCQELVGEMKNVMARAQDS